MATIYDYYRHNTSAFFLAIMNRVEPFNESVEEELMELSDEEKLLQEQQLRQAAGCRVLFW